MINFPWLISNFKNCEENNDLLFHKFGFPVQSAENQDLDIEVIEGLLREKDSLINKSNFDKLRKKFIKEHIDEFKDYIRAHAHEEYEKRFPLFNCNVYEKYVADPIAVIKDSDAMHKYERAVSVLQDLVTVNKSIFMFPSMLEDAGLDPKWSKIANAYFRGFNTCVADEDKIVHDYMSVKENMDKLIKCYEEGDVLMMIPSRIDFTSLCPKYRHIAPEAIGNVLAYRLLVVEKEKYLMAKYRNIVLEVYDKIDVTRQRFFRLKRKIFDHMYEIYREGSFLYGDDTDEEARRWAFEEFQKILATDTLKVISEKLKLNISESALNFEVTVNDLEQMPLDKLAEYLHALGVNEPTAEELVECMVPIPELTFTKSDFIRKVISSRV